MANSINIEQLFTLKEALETRNRGLLEKVLREISPGVKIKPVVKRPPSKKGFGIYKRGEPFYQANKKGKKNPKKHKPRL